MKTGPRWMHFHTNDWRDFAICLIGVTLIGVGVGIFMVLLVTYLERSGVPVSINGTIMAVLSAIEGVTCLLTGFLARGRYGRGMIAASVLVLSAGPAILATQPSINWVWLGAALAGLGMGVMSVALYAAALARRPSALALGMAIGLYTACIAVGNGLGSLLGGAIADGRGFGAAFTVSAVTLGAVSLLMLTLSGQVEHPSDTTDIQQTTDLADTDEVDAAPAWVWILGVTAALSLAGVNTAFDALFPVYGLRVGLTLTTIGTLFGIRGFLAAVVRPFSGAILARANIVVFNALAIVAMVLSTALIPLAGQGAGLVGLVGLIGLAFGASRVISATLLLRGQCNPEAMGKRISLYNAALSVGAILGPWSGGWLAWHLSLPKAIVLVPTIILALFLSSAGLMPWLSKRMQLPQSIH